MPLVQLSKLRSQINALESHFRDPEVFQDALISLFLIYEDKKSSTNIWLMKNSQFLSHNVPKSVMSELESRIAVLSRAMPESAFTNADRLWKNSYYEPKKIAIILISNPDDSHEKDYFHRVETWLSVDLEEILIKDILASVELKPNLLQSMQWLAFIKTLLESKDTREKKLGLQALNKTLVSEYQNLPLIFSLLTPLVKNPQLPVQKDLISIIRALIHISQAETASFLLMIKELYPGESVLVFTRKCLPLFDNYFQDEIRKALTVH